MFEAGTTYGPREDCTIPVKVRDIPRVDCREWTPDQIAIHRTGFTCTLGYQLPSDDITNIMAAYKDRASVLSSVVRDRKAEARERKPIAEPTGELRQLEREYQKQFDDLEQRLSKIEAEQASCSSELQRVNRELAICDQQDTALTQQANILEAKRSEIEQSDVSSAASNMKTLSTQLSDISYFRASSRKARLQLLGARDSNEQRMLSLNQEHTVVSMQKAQAETRKKLIKTLQRGGLGNLAQASVEDSFLIAMSKAEELSATWPQTLAGIGRFLGFQEVLAISDRALQDVSSALKEISGVGSADGAVIAEALEANLKLRKDINQLIQERLLRAEYGRPGLIVNGQLGELAPGDLPHAAGIICSRKGAGGCPPDCKGGFFKECHIDINQEEQLALLQ
eukprot:TRINITY_DN20840_c0_g1_i2.p1 TRINITY_DN20840_c0_g1~~TRINITY_DN20840_c0_g1_i2.p1  ORF type:complete len:396 (+),score=100.77 TRINITY_DN20840_c0_g1_i2:314-1501(+)